MQANTASSVKGFDISHYQGTPDMAKAKAAGYQFVYVKSSEGTTYVDPTFATNVKDAHTAGLLVGAYHFARPDQDSAVTEANHFISLLQANPTDLMPVLDLEEPTTKGSMTGADLAAWSRTFINTVQSAVGHKVMLYTGNWFINEYSLVGLSDIPLWDSYYSSTAPPSAGGWTEWTAWQYSDKGTVAGVSGGVDVDYAVSLEALEGNIVATATTTRTIFLPSSNAHWTVYHTDKPPVISNSANIAGVLQPAKFPPGLTYDIVGNGNEPDTYLIKTSDFGLVKIWAGPNSGAVIHTTVTQAPTPAPAPTTTTAPAYVVTQASVQPATPAPVAVSPAPIVTASVSTATPPPTPVVTVVAPTPTVADTIDQIITALNQLKTLIK